MNEAESKLVQTLQQAGYEFFEIVGILAAITGFANMKTREEVSRNMGTVAANALSKYSK